MIKYEITLYSYGSNKNYYRKIYYMLNRTNTLSMIDYFRFIQANSFKKELTRSK